MRERKILDTRHLSRSVSAAGMSALFLACLHGHASCAELLLESGADVEWEMEKSGATALLAAARHGHAGCVAALLRRGASTAVNSEVYGGDVVAAAHASANAATIRLISDPQRAMATSVVPSLSEPTSDVPNKEGQPTSSTLRCEASLRRELASALRAADA